MAKKTTRKAPGTKTPPIKETIVTAALALAAAQGWENVSLNAIAKKAKITLAALQEHVEDKADILILFERQVDRKVLEAMEQSGPIENPRDRLFEVMMERFDVLQTQRDGLVSILNTLLCDPKQALIGLPHFCRSMNWMLEVSGVDTSGIKGAAKVLGLSAIYLKVLRDWKEDESQDMSRTMAALDQALGHAETIVQKLHL